MTVVQILLFNLKASGIFVVEIAQLLIVLPAVKIQAVEVHSDG